MKNEIVSVIIIWLFAVMVSVINVLNFIMMNSIIAFFHRMKIPKTNFVSFFTVHKFSLEEN